MKICDGGLAKRVGSLTLNVLDFESWLVLVDGFQLMMAMGTLGGYLRIGPCVNGVAWGLTPETVRSRPTSGANETKVTKPCG